MSIETWMDEYLPEKFEKDKDEDPKSTVVRAVKHCQKKYSGIKNGILEKHGVMLNGKTLVEVETQGGRTILDTNNCALCELFYCSDDGCENCPIVRAGYLQCEWPGSGWATTKETGDSSKMIWVLQATLEYVENNKDEQWVFCDEE